MQQKIILLVEDDFLNRRLSKKALIENNYQVWEAKNAKEAVDILNKEFVDLAILDINLGEEEPDGISLGWQIQQTFSIPFIYLTAYENAEIIDQAMPTTPYSYLTKPFKNIDLITSVEIALRQSGKKQIPKIAVKDNEYQVNLSADAINYIVSEGNYLLFHTDKKTYKSRSTIKQILEQLSESPFVQVHRAYVVNRSKIEKFNLKSVVVNNTEIPISKNFTEHIIVSMESKKSAWE